jgi:LysR family glycine cleavage system transcriptional activator
MLERRELLRPFDLMVAEDVSVWLVYPERRRNLPAIRAFRAWLTGEMRALGAGPEAG